MQDNIDDVIISLIAKVSEIPITNIKISSKFDCDLDMDSLAILDLVMQIEEEFDIEITDEELKHIPTVQSVTELVRQKISAL